MKLFLFALCLLAATGLRAAPMEESPGVKGIVEGCGKLTAELAKSFRIRAYATAERRGRTEKVECRATLSATGEFKAFGLPKGDVQLWAELTGWVSEPVKVSVTEQTQIVNFSMHAAGRIRVLADFKGRPARQVKVIRIACANGPAWFTLDPVEPDVLVLGKEPLAFDCNVPTSVTELCVRWHNDEVLFSPFVDPFTITAAQTTDVVIAVDPCAWLTLVETENRHVRSDDVTLTPDVADAPAPRIMETSMMTGSAVKYSVKAIAIQPGKWSLCVARKRYEPHSAELELKPGEHRFYSYVLTPEKGSRLTGVIIDQEDKPVAGAAIKVSGARDAAITDAHGRFALHDPFAGDPDPITISADGFRDETLEPAAAGEIRIRLNRATAIRGTIRGGAGMSLRIKFVREYPEKNAGYSNQLADGSSRPDGTYCLTLKDNASQGHIVLTHGGQTLAHRVENVANGQWHKVDLSLPEGPSISGKATGPDGRALSGLKIGCFCFVTNTRSYAVTSADGLYKFGALLAGKYGVSPEENTPDWAELDSSWVVVGQGGNATRNFDYTGTCRVKFRVTLKGRPARSLEIRRGKHGLPIARADALRSGDGVLEVAGMPAGTYQVEYSDQEHRDVIDQLVIPAGVTELNVEKDISQMSLAGRVKLPPGISAADRKDWEVVMFDGPDFPLPRAAIGADGTYRFDDIKPGAYRAVAMLPGWASEAVTVKIAGNTTQDFELRAAGSVSLTVTFADTTLTATEASVTLVPAGSSIDDGFYFRSVNLDAMSPSFVSRSVLPGRYSVVLHRYGGPLKGGIDFYRVKDFEIDVEAGKDTRNIVGLRACAAVLIRDPGNVLGGHSAEFYDSDNKKVGSLNSLGGGGRNSWRRFTELPPGDLKLVVSKQGFKTLTMAVKTVIGETKELTVELEKE